MHGTNFGSKLNQYMFSCWCLHVSIKMWGPFSSKSHSVVRLMTFRRLWFKLHNITDHGAELNTVGPTYFFCRHSVGKCTQYLIQINGWLDQARKVFSGLWFHEELNNYEITCFTWEDILGYCHCPPQHKTINATQSQDNRQGQTTSNRFFDIIFNTDLKHARGKHQKAQRYIRMKI